MTGDVRTVVGAIAAGREGYQRRCIDLGSHNLLNRGAD